jgi:hypothetical protein
MTTTTLAAPATPTAALDAYQLVDADEVRAFLAAHPFLEPLLGEVAAQLPQYFPGAPLRLQVEVEHDAAGRPRPQLVVVAIVPGWTADAAQDAMDEFADQWWLSQMDRAWKELVITLAFG